ncbi:hypothetical protein AB8O64_36270 (plasmid) [Streptomyces sp. QH1-20]|uniref:hypothetical protein n=1 Tax=Streptomyces sp. QH1-20 TaxID=3240934 RepID=UPI0035121963
MEPFFFESAIKSPIEYKGEETPKDTEKINELLRSKKFSFRHYSDGVGRYGERPPWMQLLSSQRLSESSLAGSGDTFAADWIMLGNEAFVFCTIAVGKFHIYDRFQKERPWYAEINPDSITDAWFSQDLWPYFEEVDDDLEGGQCYVLETADDARETLEKAEKNHKDPKVIVPMIRSNGRNLLRMVARILVDRDVSPEADDEAIVKAAKDFFGEGMEVKVAQSCIPLDPYPGPGDPSPWRENPLMPRA